MHGFIERNAQHIQYRFMAHFCAFNQNDRQAIWEGFKKRIAREEAIPDANSVSFWRQTMMLSLRSGICMALTT